MRSVLDYLDRTDLESVFGKDQAHEHFPYGDNVSFPNFDVRENTAGYILEGDFPGLHDPNDIVIEKLGSQGLLIETKVPALHSHEQRDEHTAQDTLERKAESKPTRDGPDESAHAAQRRHGELKPHGEGKKSVEDRNDHRKHTEHKDKIASKHREDSAGAEKATTLLSERHVGRLQRSFTFPQPVDYGNLKAKLKDGVLQIWLPKSSSTARQPSRFPVEYSE